MIRSNAGMILCTAALILAGCSDKQQDIGPGDATISETRAIQDAAEMTKVARPSTIIDTNAPLPQTSGDKAPNQAQ